MRFVVWGVVVFWGRVVVFGVGWLGLLGFWVLYYFLKNPPSRLGGFGEGEKGPKFFEGGDV